jgi:hypothetical protein
MARIAADDGDATVSDGACQWSHKNAIARILLLAIGIKQLALRPGKTKGFSPPDIAVASWKNATSDHSVV